MLDETQREAVINALFVMAWKDGHVTAEEKSILDRILMRLGVPRSEIMQLIEERSKRTPAAEQLDLLLNDQESRLEAMEYLIAVCFSDSQLATEELEYIYELATRFNVTADQLEALRHKAERLVDPGSHPLPSASAAGPMAGAKKPMGIIKLDQD